MQLNYKGHQISFSKIINYLKYKYYIKYTNPITKYKIKKLQKKLLCENYSNEITKLIIFLTPGLDIVNGGILSVTSIYTETIKIKNIHGSEVIMCTVPGEPLLLKYTRFKNQNFIYMFSEVLLYFQNLQELIIHIPEYIVEKFLKNCSNYDNLQLNKIKSVHINIMLQNINYLPDEIHIKNLGKLGQLTCTTAHERYSNSEIREKLGCPLHKLSVYVSPEQYNKKSYFEKEDLMIVSPDNHPKRSAILGLIARQFPQLKIQIIENLTYEQYKNVISKAKWALTFGEGLDGYFVETIFSGGVAFSVFNEKFFSDDFKSLRTVYPDYDVLIKKISLDIKDLDNKISFMNYHKIENNLCCKYYNYNNYINNLALFYKGEYTIP